MDKFEIIDVQFSPEDIEQLGTKEKFWFYFGSEEDSEKWLFKFSRKNTGEHWSEKIAEQLCERLSIPHVSYELASCDGRHGIITPNIVPSNGRMIMGNEVLHSLSPEMYPSPQNNESVVRVREHTVTRVLSCFDDEDILPPENFSEDDNDLNSGDVFCGYLMLDALISNQDRHHENWAVIVDESNSISLCPTYDHAASLGRELLDENRSERLHTKDVNRGVPNFVSRARSELYRKKSDKKALKTKDTFFHATENRVLAKEFWLSKLTSLSNEDVIEIVNNVPDNVITTIAKDFVVEMVLENKRRLLEDGT